jgi:hypothetical protein
MDTGSANNVDTEGPDVLAAQFDAWLALTGQARAAGGNVRLPMLSGSMYPALPRGCTLVIEPLANGGTATSGQVAVLARDGRLVAHRVLLRMGARVLEMGDANRRATWRPAAEIVGRVVGALAVDGTALPDPGSRRRAWRNLLRHWRGALLGVAGDEDAN